MIWFTVRGTIYSRMKLSLALWRGSIAPSNPLAAIYKELKIDMQRYDKLEDEKDKGFTKLPSYMEGKCLEDIRLAFRIKSKMVRKIKMN